MAVDPSTLRALAGGSGEDLRTALKDAVALATDRGHRIDELVLWCEQVKVKRTEAEDDAAEARGELEDCRAYCALTQSELDDVAALVGVGKDAAYGELKDAITVLLDQRRVVLARLRDVISNAKQTANFADQVTLDLGELRRDVGGS